MFNRREKCDELEAWLKSFRNGVYSRVANSRRRNSHEVSSILRHGLLELRKGPWRAIPTDKNGNYCLALYEDVQRNNFLDFHSYVYIDPAAYSIWQIYL